MVKSVGTVDEQPYPGPPDGAELLAWSNFNADVLGAFAAWKAHYHTMGTAFTMASSGLASYCALMDETHDLVDDLHHDKNVKLQPNKKSGRRPVPRHVGPRSERAYDRKGRRKN